MLRFAADENLNRHLLRGILRRLPDLDFVRIQDVGLASEDDPTVLEWCAREDRLLVTHDANTITRYARDRVARGAAMPGVVEVAQTAPLGAAIEDLALLAEAGESGEFSGQILYIPF